MDAVSNRSVLGQCQACQQFQKVDLHISAQRLLSFDRQQSLRGDVKHQGRKLTFGHEIQYGFCIEGWMTFQGADSLVDVKATHPHSSVWNMVFLGPRCDNSVVEMYSLTCGACVR